MSWLLILLAVSFPLTGILAAGEPLKQTTLAIEPPAPMPPDPSQIGPAPQGGDRLDKKNGKYRKMLGQATWRAFSALSEKERQELMTLQRSNPDAFRAKMNALGEKRLAEERARFQELKGILTQYKKSTDEAERSELAKRISAMIRSEYFERLAHNRRHLEEMKRNTQRLEEELNKRTEKAEEIIKAQIDATLLSGELPRPPRPPRD